MFVDFKFVTNFKKNTKDSSSLNLPFIFTSYTNHTIRFRIIFLKGSLSTIISNTFTVGFGRYFLKCDMYFLFLSRFLPLDWQFLFHSQLVTEGEHSLSQLYRQLKARYIKCVYAIMWTVRYFCPIITTVRMCQKKKNQKNPPDDITPFRAYRLTSRWTVRHNKVSSQISPLHSKIRWRNFEIMKHFVASSCLLWCRW
jgi:hypothetical protein